MSDAPSGSDHPPGTNDSDDTPEPTGDTPERMAPADDGAGGFAFSRRSVLRTGASLGVATGLAGCGGIISDVTSYTFRAAPVKLAANEDPPDYALVTRTEDIVEREPTVGGTRFEVEIVSEAAVYDGDVDTLGLLSSPTASVAGQKQNPLATEPIADIIVGPEGDRLLSGLGFVEQSSVQWVDGPTSVGTGSGELLGQRTDVTAYAGDTRQSGFILLTVARVTDSGDVVYAATAQQREGQASTLVGPDGYVDQATVDESVARLETVLPRVERGGSGIRLVESANITTKDDDPNYVRVVAENQYGDRPLHGISIAAQFYDGDGELVDVADARVPSLGAEEQFEGYVPYTSDDVAGYALDAEHTNRSITGAASKVARIADESRSGDTVSVTVENTATGTLPFVNLEVTFRDDDGTVLTTNQRSIPTLDPGERRELDVVYSPSAVQSPAAIADHEVALVEYSGNLQHVR